MLVLSMRLIAHWLSLGLYSIIADGDLSKYWPKEGWSKSFIINFDPFNGGSVLNNGHILGGRHSDVTVFIDSALHREWTVQKLSS